MINSVEYAGEKNFNTVHFLWQLTDKCQYACTYCSAFNNNLVKFDDTIIDLVLKRLKLYDGKFSIELYGGEPTVHPKLLRIVDFLDGLENCERIELITNLRRSKVYFMQFDKFSSKFSITPSYHPEYDHKYEEKCIFLFKKFKNIKIIPYVNLIDKKEYWEKTLEIIKKFNENEMDFRLNMLMSTPSYQVNYTEEFFKVFNEHIEKQDIHKFRYKFQGQKETFLYTNFIERNNLDSFKGYNCKALMYDIDIFGNITNSCFRNTEKIMLKSEDLTKYRKCILDNCNCNAKFDFHKFLKN